MMSEYIVNVPDEEAEYFIARFGFENVKLTGYSLTGEIVRCRDCRHFHPMEGTALSCRLPHPQYGHLVQWQFAEPDGFCWRAERKEGGDD